MHWWPFGKRRRREKRPQSAEPPREMRQSAKAVQLRSYTAPASAAPQSPVSPVQKDRPGDARLFPISHEDEIFTLDNPNTTTTTTATTTTNNNNNAAVAIGAQKQVQAQDSYEELTALPKSRGIEHSPHLRPLPESELNNRSKRSATDAALLRRKSSKQRKGYDERAAQLRAMTQPIQIPEKKKKPPIWTTGADFAFLSRSASKRDRKASKKVVEQHQHQHQHQLRLDSTNSLPDEPSARSSMTGHSADRNRFEFGSIGVLSPRPQLRYSMGSPAAANRSNAPSRGGAASPPAITHEFLKESKTIDEFADDLDAHTLRELMDRDRRRRSRKAAREGQAARKKLDKSADREKSTPKPKARRKSSPRPVDTIATDSEAGPSGTVRRVAPASDVETGAMVMEDIFQRGEAPLTVDEGQRADGKKSSDVVEEEEEEEAVVNEEEERGRGREAERDDVKMKSEAAVATTNSDAAAIDAGTSVDQPELEPKSRAQLSEAKVERFESPGATADVKQQQQVTATTAAISDSEPTRGPRAFKENEFVAIPYDASVSPSPPVSAADSGRVSGLSLPTDGRSTPVEELNRSMSRTSIQRSGTLSALFRRSGTGKRRSQDQASELSFSNTSRESMARQPPPAHLVRDAHSPDLYPRRTSGTLRSTSRFREDLPEYTIPIEADVVPALPKTPPATSTTSVIAETEDATPISAIAGTEDPTAPTAAVAETKGAFITPAVAETKGAFITPAVAETEDDQDGALETAEGAKIELPPPLPEKSLMRSKSQSVGSEDLRTNRNTVILAGPPPIPMADAISTAQKEPSEPASPILPQTLASVDSEGSWLTGRPNRRSSQRTSLEQSAPSSPIRERILGGDLRYEDGGSTSAVATPRARRPLSPVDRFSAASEDYSGDEGASTPQAQAGQTVRLEQIVRGSLARSPTVVYYQPRAKSNEGLMREFDEDGIEFDGEGSEANANANEHDDAETLEYAASSSHLGSTQYDTASEGYGTEPEEAETPDVNELPISYGIQHARTASSGSARILDIVNRARAGLDATADAVGVAGTEKASMDTARAPSPR